MKNEILDLFLGQLNIETPRANKIYQYIDLLQIHNEKCNLIGRKQDLDRIVSHHIIDSLLPLDRPLDPAYRMIYDIGTGAGLPGLLWAMTCPDREFFLVEKSPKKCHFLSEATKLLGLNNVHILNNRCEDLKGRADLVISRAMTSCVDLIDLCSAIRSKKTVFWLFKALRSSIDEELKNLNCSLWKADLVVLNHPFLDISRHIVQISALQ